MAAAFISDVPLCYMVSSTQQTQSNIQHFKTLLLIMEKVHFLVILGLSTSTKRDIWNVAFKWIEFSSGVLCTVFLSIELKTAQDKKFNELKLSFLLVTRSTAVLGMVQWWCSSPFLQAELLMGAKPIHRSGPPQGKQQHPWLHVHPTFPRGDAGLMNKKEKSRNSADLIRNHQDCKNQKPLCEQCNWAG